MTLLQKRDLARQQRRLDVCGKLCIWLAGALLLVGLAGRHVEATETADLRGYGKVEARLGKQMSEFVCENEAKADILFGKLLADMFWDAGNKHVEKTVGIRSSLVGETEVTIYVYPPYGAMLAARNKNRVLILGGKDEKEIVNIAETQNFFTSESTIFKPAKPYPKYLDFYDLRAVTCYTKGMHPENKYRYMDRSEFVRKFFKGGMVFSAAAFRATPAESILPAYSLLDTDMNLAEKEDQMYSIAISTGFWPAWAQNTWPDYIERQSPMSLFSTVGVDVLPESFGLAPQQRRQTSLKLLKDVMLRYKDSPAMGGWHLYCGDYSYETHFDRDIHGHYGYSPIGLEGFRRWLRDVRGYSLQEVGKRWYGDARHFKQWSDVSLPDAFEFFGKFDSASFQIADHWFWRKAETNELERPADDAPGWTPVAMPPSSMEAIALPSAPAFWRSTFDASTWLAANARKDVYMVCDINNKGWKEYEVWLNGKTLGKFKSTVNPHSGPIALKVNGLLTSGVNSLVLSAPEGHMMGPVFLTTSMPEAYPYLGLHENARYVDMLEWRLDELNFKVDDAMTYARSIDPDKPFVICATSAEVKDGQGWALTRFGGSMQDTGYETSFRQFNSRLGYAGGFYGSCEASGLPTSDPLNPDAGLWTKSLGRMINWTLFNGEGSHMFWRDPYCFFAIEKKTGWFTDHIRNIQLVGKYLPEKPDIAILFSSRSALLDPYVGHSMWESDIGRRALPAAHYDNVYVTDTMLARGMADEYPVLFDTDTRVMGQDMIGAIRKYVEKGGTFVALNNTGRHGILEPDTWPISELTGFKVLSVGKKGKIRFERNLPLFKGWEGKVFEGEGNALDLMDTQSVVLAKWEDGSVAVGERKLGKGKVILLGSAFWRQRTEFLESLFTDLGVKRTAIASNKGVFARKMITKNGLQEWLVVMDQTGTGMMADAGFATAGKPAEVWDMAAQKPVAFEYADGWVKINDIKLEPWELRVFGAKRATMSEGVDFWWREKVKFWRRASLTQPFVETVQDDQSNPAAIPFPTWRFCADKDNSIAHDNQWLQPSFNDGNWRNIGNEAWNLKFEDLKTYAGVGLYRSLAFDIPSKWEGKRLTLNADGYFRHMGFCFNRADFFINGTKIEGIPRPYRQADITGELKEKGNVLCIKLTGKDPSGDYPLSGLLDCTVWIQPEIQLQNVMSLAGTWQAVMGGWASNQPVTLPGKAQGHHFVKDVAVPSAWQGKSVYVHVRNSPGIRPPVYGMGNGLIFVNGQPITIFSLFHKQNAPEDTVNLTPYIKCGETNRIELWPQFAQKDPGKEYNFAIETIEMAAKSNEKAPMTP